MFVKKQDHKQREFKGVKFLVGATGERMMVTLMQFKRGDRVGSNVNSFYQNNHLPV